MRSYGIGRMAWSCWLLFVCPHFSPCRSLLHSIILFPPPPSQPVPPSLHCLSISPTVTGLPERFTRTLTHTHIHSARGLGRSVISPVFSLTWNIWHCDTRKERESLCVYMSMCGCEVLQEGRGGVEERFGKKGFQSVIFYFFPLWALTGTAWFPQWGHGLARA